jgi:hypothetical protein
MTDVLPWQRVAPRDGESARWQCIDGRWVAVASGHGATAGGLLVLDSRGRCELVASIDDAHALARCWRSGA